ncbi:hypothetical protein ACQKM1_22585 [Peribacillus frigoritolerans]|uniref:hypothetical protein n=1 Tax=Peribacillus frigoritolerans TaxID=450367 RepID=UPI003D040B0E
MSVVRARVPHTSSVKEMVKVAKTSIENIGERKEVSKEALERFFDIYLKVVKKNEKKLQNK